MKDGSAQTKKCPSVEMLHALFDYDPNTGILWWKAGNYKSRAAGTPDRAGYIRVICGGQSFPAHRLI